MLQPGLALLLLVLHAEVSELERVFGICDDTDVLPELLFFEELLGEVFQVALAKGRCGGDADLLVQAFKGDGTSDLTGFAVHLDFVREKFFLNER